jgi:hypothetical protein
MRPYVLARLLRRGPTREEAFDRFAGPLVRTPSAARKEQSAPVTAEREPFSAGSSDAATPEWPPALERERRSVRGSRSPAPAAPPAKPGAAHGRSESRSAPPR